MYQRSVLINLPKAQTIDIEFTNISYQVRTGFRSPKKPILKGVSGCFKSGELTAIMGPSGAGKSTLLNVLTGFQGYDISGSIEYTSEDNQHGWSMYRKAACYIQQDDQLHSLFTTIESMTIAANLKIGSSLNDKAKQMLIDDILETLDLTKTKETRCDRLSGGQRKRLSIALELIDNPPILFLDEPTTGLDSSSTLQCIAMLKNLASDGRTIVCTIHQPSAAIYEMFDHVYLLADGHCMYQGAPSNTISYFANSGLHCPQYHNPADYIIEVVSKEYGNFNEQLSLTAKGTRCWRTPLFVKTPIYVNGLPNNSSVDCKKATVFINPPSELARFWVLLNRCIIQLYRDWTVTHLKIVLHFLVAVILGLVFVDAGSDGSKTINNIGFLLITCIYLCYTSMLPAVLRFPTELPILKKEKFNNWYQLRTFYAAFLAANIPVQMIFAVVYTTVSYFLSRQPLDLNRFLMFLIVTMMTTVVAESIGLLIGTTTNPINGTFIGAILTAVLLLFAGFLVFLRHMPRFMYYFTYLSYLRYALQGLVQAIYGNNREKLPCPSSVDYCHYRSPSSILTELAMADAIFWVDMMILVGYFVAFRVIGYCTLKKKLSGAI
ncbi:ATP-binding cassette sub-family G member 4-like [Cotesia glomerata]|uniref:ABC transporter domain-containing protein n=1 Tax=Cotesia glomerata TaxID=32391 RepID=A0AAV7IB09_COTGL|nr:ATP-binding cassette sub-family G member 4-like [Cotesia glomerata]KAH0547421.1 hypothetical protein KQX54_019261 [Cotesia glomerata]